MQIAIVIVNFNGASVIKDCLSSVSKLNTDSHKILTIVVDNASNDDSATMVKEQFPQATLIENRENLGFSEGNNVGIRYALDKGSQYVMLLNNDTIIGKNCIKELVVIAEKEKKAGILGPKIYFESGYEFHYDKYRNSDRGKVIWYAGGRVDWANVIASHRGVDEVDTGQYDGLTKTSFVTGCAMLIKREVFSEIGLLDQKLFLYYEDLDFCKRAQNKGFEIYYVPQAVAWHKNAATAGGSGSDLQQYYITRNRLLMGMRYAPWKTKLALFREATSLLFWGTLTQKQAVGDFLRKKFGKRDWVPRMINLLKRVSFKK